MRLSALLLASLLLSTLLMSTLSALSIVLSSTAEILVLLFTLLLSTLPLSTLLLSTLLLSIILLSTSSPLLSNIRLSTLLLSTLMVLAFTLLLLLLSSLPLHVPCTKMLTRKSVVKGSHVLAGVGVDQPGWVDAAVKDLVHLSRTGHVEPATGVHRQRPDNSTVRVALHGCTEKGRAGGRGQRAEKAGRSHLFA